MKLIQQVKGRIRRPQDGNPVDQQGDQFFVDEAGSAAVVGGRLYINGRAAPPGRHSLGKDGALVVDVDQKGRAKRADRPAPSIPAAPGPGTSAQGRKP